MKHQVLVVDDHPVVRDGLRALLSAQADLEICGEAAHVNEAIRLVGQSPVDVVLLDLSLKDCHGLTALGSLMRHVPRAKVLVYSCGNEELYAERVLRAGAMGYIQKSESSERVLAAIRCVAAGEVYVSSRIARQLLSRLGHARGDESALASLSDRELTVFQSLGHGLTAKQIARQLLVSMKTIESCREAIKRKLRLSTSTELNWYAVRWVLEGNETAAGDLPPAIQKGSRQTGREDRHQAQQPKDEPSCTADRG